MDALKKIRLVYFKPNTGPTISSSTYVESEART